MKLKIRDKVYLQKYEVARLLGVMGNCDSVKLPSTLVNEIFAGGDAVFFMNGGPDGLSFDVVVEEPENVEWVMAQDYILDFERFKDYSIEDLEKLAAETEERGRATAQDFNSQSYEYRREHHEEMSELMRKTASAQVGYHFMVAYLAGEREFIFPKGYKPANKASVPETTKKPGLLGRVTRLFSRKRAQ